MDHIKLHQTFPELSSNDIDVYFVLSELIGQKEYTDITPQELEQITGTTHRTIRKNLIHLVKIGLIRFIKLEHTHRRGIALIRERAP